MKKYSTARSHHARAAAQLKAKPGRDLIQSQREREKIKVPNLLQASISGRKIDNDGILDLHQGEDAANRTLNLLINSSDRFCVPFPLQIHRRYEKAT